MSTIPIPLQQGSGASGAVGAPGESAILEPRLLGGNNQPSMEMAPQVLLASQQQQQQQRQSTNRPPGAGRPMEVMPQVFLPSQIGRAHV